MEQPATEEPTSLGARTRARADSPASAIPARRAYLADLGLVGVTVIWGSTFVVVKDALAGVGPFEFIALRFGVAFLALAVIFRRRVATLGGEGWRAGFLIGAILFSGYALQTTGLRLTTASTAAFITGLSVLIVPFVAFVVVRQGIGPGVAVGVALAPIGLWLLTAGRQGSFGLGEILVLGCAVAFAAHIVSISKYAPRYDPLGLAVVQVGVVAALATIVSPIVEQPSLAVDRTVWVAALYTGLLGSAVVLGVQTSIQRYTTATHAALIFSLEPVFAAGFAYLLAGETLGATGLLGGVILIAAMLIAEFKR